MGDKRYVLNDKRLATTIVSIARSLTVGPLAEPGRLGTGIDPETGTEIGGPEDGVYASVANAVLGASTPTTETTSTGKILVFKKYETVSMKCWRKILVTHLVGLSELESISIDDELGVDARDKMKNRR
jgi:hypothetical protein